MGYVRQQNSTNYPILFLVVDSSDHTTGKMGLFPSAQISKNGNIFASALGVITELNYGWYSLTPNAIDRDTLGTTSIHVTSGSIADPVDFTVDIVNYNPFLGVAEDIWGYNNRTLTFSVNNLMSISDTGLSFVRGDTINYTFDDLDLTDYSKVYFTVKKQYKDADCDALLQVVSGGGLVILNGQKRSTGTGASLTAGSVSGSAILVVDASITKLIPYSDNNYYYDLQIITTGCVVSTPCIGEFSLIRDVTNKIV